MIILRIFALFFNCFASKIFIFNRTEQKKEAIKQQDN